MAERCEYCGQEDRYGHNAVCVMNEVIELRAALERVLADIAEYERVNNLAPNPGRQYCWDSVAHAHTVLNIHKRTDASRCRETKSGEASK